MNTITRPIRSDRSGPGAQPPRLIAADVTGLETAIDRLEADLPDLRNFIPPRGVLAAAHLHLARTLCRRAERRVTTLRRQDQAAPHLAAYLNRLSDLLFVLARHVNRTAGTDDIVWAPRS
ncbi:ATP:cob(I)alamin adenosyltransferase [Actinomadura sp. KC345]|uniref:ATP:cob(I)alamin adenosyltransferase n=1 Tax=Actinomadura sp. KC345 TaxID=2530371 RepID=UPI001A9D1FBC|nr:ATP:cob(I)alamin adenosyltransferase [Actinomadura sp. KC345]